MPLPSLLSFLNFPVFLLEFKSSFGNSCLLQVFSLSWLRGSTARKRTNEDQTRFFVPAALAFSHHPVCRLVPAALALAGTGAPSFSLEELTTALSPVEAGIPIPISRGSGSFQLKFRKVESLSL